MAGERTVLVRLKAEVSDFQRGMVEAAAAVKGLTKEIDTSTDRTAWMAQGILALAPAAVTAGAGVIPAVAGIATQMTITAAAAGTMVLAFHGIGGALTALNNYQLDPTTAHLAKLHETMQALGPEGAQFVHFLDSLTPKLSGLSDTARAGMFPGIESGATHLLDLLPKVRVIVGEIASGIGELSKEAGAGLAGPKFEAFFTWLETDAKPILLDMGRTVGNLAEGLANMLVAFAPESKGFSDGLLQMSRSFAKWSRSLDENQSFQHFLDYIHKSGPQALAFLGSLIDAGTSLIKAWAPVGSVTLPALTTLLNIISKLADTPLGPTVLGIAALASTYGRLAAIGKITNSGVFTKFNGGLIAQTKAANAARPSLVQLGGAFQKNTQYAETSRAAIGKYAKSMAPAGIAAGAFALIASGTAQKIGLTNTASLAMAGTMVGPWGTAIGAGVGALLDFRAAQGKSAALVASLTSSLNQQTGALTDNTRQMVVNALNSKGAYDTAQQLGISTNLVTQAALGHGDALAKVNAQLAEYTHQGPVVVGAGGSVTGALGGQAVAAANLSDTLNGTNGEVQSATAKWLLNQKELGKATGATLKAQAAQKQLAASTRAARTAANTQAQQWVTLGKDIGNAKVSLDGWIRELQKQANALRDFTANAQRAADKGLRHGLIDALKEAGPEGAMRMKQLADASQTEIGKANRAWGSMQRAVGGYEDAAVAASHLHLSIDVRQALANIGVLHRQIDELHGKTVIIRATGGHVAYDTGGYTGPGHRKQVAGVVHAGEVVIPQYETARDWGMLKARYGYLPGFANGGYVSGGMQSASRMTVDMSGMEVTGSLDTPWGPANIHGIARAEARDVYSKESSADRHHDRQLAGMRGD